MYYSRDSMWKMLVNSILAFVIMNKSILNQLFFLNFAENVIPNAQEVDHL